VKRKEVFYSGKHTKLQMFGLLSHCSISVLLSSHILERRKICDFYIDLRFNLILTNIPEMLENHIFTYRLNKYLEVIIH